MRVEPRDGSERPADSRPNAALPRSLKGNKTSDFLMKESSSASMHDDRRQEFLLAALPMKVWQILPNLIGVGFLSCAMVSPQEAIDRTGTSTATHDGASNSFVMQPGIPVKREEPCVEAQIGPNAAPPTWDSPASTTQCGTLETDSFLIEEAVGAGVLQQTLATTAKYGLTSHLEVRWGLPGKMAKGGGGTPRLQGTTDQWIGACYRFHDEGRWTPDLALDFAIKFPTANPAKGFGAVMSTTSSPSSRAAIGVRRTSTSIWRGRLLEVRRGKMALLSSDWPSRGRQRRDSCGRWKSTAGRNRARTSATVLRWWAAPGVYDPGFRSTAVTHARLQRACRTSNFY